jgi:hypothetical protein
LFLVVGGREGGQRDGYYGWLTDTAASMQDDGAGFCSLCLCASIYVCVYVSVCVVSCFLSHYLLILIAQCMVCVFDFLICECCVSNVKRSV